MSTVEETAAAIRAGKLAIVPTDTVYGLAAASSELASRSLYRLKGRDELQPTALVLESVERLLEIVPELRGDGEVTIRNLLPGPYTLVLANPVHRFSWLTGGRPDAIGVRVPVLMGAARELLGSVGALVATSANLPGEAPARSLDELPRSLLEGVAAVLDGGTLDGVPSTVLDLTGAAPVVLREGVVRAADALACARGTPATTS